VPTVFANCRSILHRGDGIVHTAVAPDVCKTPSPGGPVPLPYPNIARDGDLASGASSVTIEGHPVALKSSNLALSTGDEAGTAGGGVVSNRIKGKLTWVDTSADVQVEGQEVARFLDATMHNGNTSNTTGVSPGGPTPPPPPAPCSPHAWIEITKGTPAERLAKLDASKDAGAPYNACVARKLGGEVGREFKCDLCGATQELDLVVGGAPGECKAGNNGAAKKQTLNYVQISQQKFGGAPVTIFFQSAAKALREAPHVAKWGATAKHEAC
jgi:uncharacterized protein DUF4150